MIDKVVNAEEPKRSRLETRRPVWGRRHQFCEDPTSLVATIQLARKYERKYTEESTILDLNLCGFVRGVQAQEGEYCPSKTRGHQPDFSHCGTHRSSFIDLLKSPRQAMLIESTK